MKQNWTYKKLGEVCEVSAGQGAPQGEKNYCSNGTPFVKAGNVEDLINGLDENCIQKVNEDVAKSHKLKLYKAGSVVFAKSGMSSMKGLVYTLKHDCYVVSHLAILTPKEIESSYLNHVLNHFKPNTLIKDEAYPSISLSDISQFTIPVPPLAEQQRIVSELDLLQGIMGKQQAQLKELDTLAQAVFYDMFGDPVENEKGWEVKRLGDVCSVVKGLVDPNDEPYCNYPHIGGANIQSNTGEFIDVKLAKEENLISGKYLFDETMILYSKIRPNLNKVALPSFKGICSADMYPIITNTKYVNKYFVRFTLTHKHFIEYAISHSGRANIPKINREDLLAYETIVPPLSLQQSFASKIESIEKQKATIAQSIAETQKLFNYTMDKYFG